MSLPHCRTSAGRFLLLCMVLLCAVKAEAADGKRDVLLLYSLGSDASSAWQRQLAKGMAQEVLKGQGGAAPEVFDERLDVVRAGEQAALAAAATYLGAKYARMAVEAVIAEN